MPGKVGTVLVLGAGVGGIAAALDLAESGFPVHLVDRSPAMGGTLAQVDQWYPDNRCQMCRLLPLFSRDECSQFCLRRGLAHPNIELIPGAEMEEVEGEAGNFEVSLKIKPHWVHPERCTGCGLCVGVCPVEVADEFNAGLLRRKAIYTRISQAIPQVYTIAPDNCNQCGKCVGVCPTGAIDLSRPYESRKLTVGAIIVSSGAEEFDPAPMGQYGFGRYANVLTSLQLERMLDPSGPWGGRPVRPSDGQPPQKVAFLLCIGSRDMERNYCSVTCCLSALKEAVLLQRQNAGAEAHLFYLDWRDFGKGHYRYYQQAKDSGVNFTPCRVPVVRENPKTQNLLVLAQGEDGSSLTSEFDLVVLSVGRCPSHHTAELSRILGVGLNKWGFIASQDFGQVKTVREGIYVCGSALAPADISQAAVQGSAAAGQASILVSPVRSQLAGQRVKPQRREVKDEEARIAIFGCRCGAEIASVVSIEQVVASARMLPGVVYVGEVAYLCLPDTLEQVKQTIAESGANRIIFAACAPYHYQRLLEGAVRQVGLDSSRWHLVNFREQLAWVHQDSRAQATEKARRLLAMAVEQLRGQEPLPVPSAPLNRRGLVIGGSISGLVAALCLAEQGFEVCLVERSAELGGSAGDLPYCFDHADPPQPFLKSLGERVKANPRIHLYLETELITATGYAGNFQTKVKTGQGTVTSIEHGAVIIATGARDYQPTEYRYGQDPRIITQKELRRRLATGSLGQLSTVVMIQCVGSRDRNHPYCSRTCCVEAIAHGLRIKEQSPQTQVFILYRDLMTDGFKEEYYTQAREAGILFLRYEPDKRPEVSISDKAIRVQIDEPGLRGSLEIEADLLVLSTGIVPTNQKLAEFWGVELTEDGFFREASKFRPVDSALPGIFVCGQANAPMSLEEEVVQAGAAAQRAATILARERLESGRVVSEVNERRCSGCALCVTACPYAAREIDEERKVAVLREVLCQGCGTCAALCPNGATKLRGLKERQVFSMLDAVL